MYRPPVPLVDQPRDLEPHQRLACAVLERAVLASKHNPKNSALREWLTSGDAAFWCHLANLSFTAFSARVRHVLDDKTRRAHAAEPGRPIDGE
jgi:hypothetical protein